MYAVYLDPGLKQTWADGSPVLWSLTVQASSERAARAKIRSGPYKNMRVVSAYPK